MINKERLEELSSVMEEISKNEDKLKLAKEQFEAENKSTIDYIKTQKEELINLKKNLTEEALKEYEETEKKKLSGGLGVRVTKTIDYDTSKALDWAKEKDMCITLDKKAFEKIAKATDLDFVTLDEKITITFPKVIKI